ncbi:MAG: ATP-dependent DNA helicase RecG [Clostridia bacterium]|nr:ATP-dependent DNA helicase RecG [Clostridia bacterium]
MAVYAFLPCFFQKTGQKTLKKQANFTQKTAKNGKKGQAMQLSALKNIGEKREKEFMALGVKSAEDLARYFPRAYLDLTSRSLLKDAYHNDVVLIAAQVNRVQGSPNPKARLKIVRAFCEQDGYPFTIVWFNQPYVANKLKTGEYLFYGRVRNEFGQRTLINPTFEPLDKNERLKGIIPVYSLKGKLTQKVVRKAVQEALQKVNIDSLIPYPLQKKYGLPSLARAYYEIHSPSSSYNIDKAAERIAIEEYFLLISAFKMIKGGKEDARLKKYSVTAREVKAFSERFGFEFTDGQKRAVNEIYENLHSPTKMNRLIQGDVGSGKTAVALCGIFMAVKSGYTAAYLSPTEVLAEQNYRILQKYFPDYRIGYLAGAMSAKEKRLMKEALKAGEVDILCGTHAILQGDVEIPSLAFVVCDEQHRFGVAQRNALSEKGEGADVLVMSATPIPRTLSLIVYGDLDITTITDKPKARQEISTSIIPESRYEDMLDYVEREVRAGKQAYFVCSKIEDDEEGELMSVKELYDELSGRLPTVRFGLLHGKMKEKEKAEVMAAFKNRETDCLVSTTVIEVGVDVPNATIMIIYNAERFGLSQLHQLRGRVGRGSEKSYCFLLMGAETESAKERLLTLKGTTDGFKIAEKDLEMRGSGDFFGTRQSGKMLTDIKNLRYSTEVIFLAKRLTDEAFEGQFDLDEVRDAAIRKYDALKDVVLN